MRRLLALAGLACLAVSPAPATTLKFSGSFTVSASPASSTCPYADSASTDGCLSAPVGATASNPTLFTANPNYLSPSFSGSISAGVLSVSSAPAATTLAVSFSHSSTVTVQAGLSGIVSGLALYDPSISVPLFGKVASYNSSTGVITLQYATVYASAGSHDPIYFQVITGNETLLAAGIPAGVHVASNGTGQGGNGTYNLTNASGVSFSGSLQALRRPAENLPNVDYGVGPTPGVTLNSPLQSDHKTVSATLTSQSGGDCTGSGAATYLVTCTLTADRSISAWDFTDIYLFVNGGAYTLTCTNCKFAYGADGIANSSSHGGLGYSMGYVAGSASLAFNDFSIDMKSSQWTPTYPAAAGFFGINSPGGFKRDYGLVVNGIPRISTANVGTVGDFTIHHTYIENLGYSPAEWYATVAPVTPNTFTGDTTSGSNQILNVSSIANLYSGTPISGTGVSGTVTSASGTTVTMSANATATNTGVTVTLSESTMTLQSWTYGTALNIGWVIEGASTPDTVKVIGGASGTTGPFVINAVETIPASQPFFAVTVHGEPDLLQTGVGYTMQNYDDEYSVFNQTGGAPIGNLTSYDTPGNGGANLLVNWTAIGNAFITPYDPNANGGVGVAYGIGDQSPTITNAVFTGNFFDPSGMYGCIWPSNTPTNSTVTGNVDMLDGSSANATDTSHKCNGHD